MKMKVGNPTFIFTVMTSLFLVIYLDLITRFFRRVIQLCQHMSGDKKSVDSLI
jgi:hypothetical protein